MAALGGWAFRVSAAASEDVRVPWLQRGASLIRNSEGWVVEGLQGYLAHKKPHPPRTLPKAHAQGPRGVLGGWAGSYERGTPVGLLQGRPLCDAALVVPGGCGAA